jgi:hypothetical protein
VTLDNDLNGQRKLFAERILQVGDGWQAKNPLHWIETMKETHRKPTKRKQRI